MLHTEINAAIYNVLHSASRAVKIVNISWVLQPCVCVFVYSILQCTVCVSACIYTCVHAFVFVLLYMVTCVRLCVCVCVRMSLQVFSNCSCVGVAGNFTASTGQCPHTDDCDRMFPYFLALSVITSFIISLGGTPGYMFLIRSVLTLKKYLLWKKGLWSNWITFAHTAAKGHISFNAIVSVVRVLLFFPSTH